MNTVASNSAPPGGSATSARDVVKSRKRVLDPNERIAEILFGLIMVLTFTGSLSVAEAGREDVRTMLIGALGCNIAWGIIDAVLYLMGTLAEKGHSLTMLRGIRSAREPKAAHAIISEALPPPVAGVVRADELEVFRGRLMELPQPPDTARLDSTDWMGGLGVFLLVFISTLPVVFPFIFMHDAPRALRLSNLIAMVMLFALGVAYGKLVGRPAWLVGISMILLGAVLVAITMALGG